MIINTIELTNVRGFTHAKLDFQPGFNLIVGINGVGKTTVLESLRISLSHILSAIKSPNISKESFNKSDININTNQLLVNTEFTINGERFDFIYSKSAKDSHIKQIESRTTQNKSIRRDKEAKESEIAWKKLQDEKRGVEEKKEESTFEKVIPSREEGITLEDIIEFKPGIKKISSTPEMGLFFSTRRSLMVKQTSKIVKSGGLIGAAFVEALSENRPFNVKMFAEWFNVRKTLAQENPENESYNRVINLVEKAIYTFLPGFSDLDLKADEITKELTFCITKASKVLNFGQLSDGERGMLALVFDIARRLIIANVHLDNPLEGEAVILVDELDLHLHPKWQRTIVNDLQRTFPNCQFIATTHSPQIIGEVMPNAINIIDKSHKNESYKPDVAFGLDAQRILEELLDAPIRNSKVKEDFIKLNKSVDDEKFEKAKKIISDLKKLLGEYDPELIRINSMIQFLEEDFENEKDN